MSYEDPEFGPSPNNSSIYGEQSTRRVLIKIPWERLRAVLGEGANLFSEAIIFNDISQGSIGDCWLISAIVALAEHAPVKIVGIFDHNELNHRQGKYIIRLYENAEVVNVVVDDLVPCDANTCNPIFGKSNWVDMWFPLLEKAFAKLYGSYFALDAGETHEAFIDLTGFPSFKYNIKNYTACELKLRLIDYSKNNFPMVVSTPTDIDENLGIKHNHCYAILRAIQLDNYFLIHLRNPSGNSIWKGDFSPNSECWTESIISEIQRNYPLFDLRDGSFWMKYEDFLKYFNTLSLCYVEFDIEKREKNIFKKVEGIGSQAFWYYIITVREDDTDIVLGLHQEDERCIGVKECRKYLDLGFVMLRKNGEKYVPYLAKKNCYK